MGNLDLTRERVIWVVCGMEANYGEFRKILPRLNAMVIEYNLVFEVYRRQDLYYTIEKDGRPRLFTQVRELEAPDYFLTYGRYDSVLEALHYQLVSMGARAINDIRAKEDALSKMRTYQKLVAAGIPQPKTMVIYHSSSPDVIIRELGLPMVVKPNDGYGGMGVSLIHSREELVDYLEMLPTETREIQHIILAQEFIATSKGRDLRVMMLGNQVLGCVIRSNKNPNDFRSNIHAGGVGEAHELTEEELRFCRKVAGETGLRFQGLDLLFGEDGYLIGEINDSPGFSAYGDPIAFGKKILAMIRQGGGL